MGAIIVKHVTLVVKLDMVVLLVGRHVGFVIPSVILETNVEIHGVLVHVMYVTLVIRDVTQHVIMDSDKLFII